MNEFIEIMACLSETFIITRFCGRFLEKKTKEEKYRGKKASRIALYLKDVSMPTVMFFIILGITDIFISNIKNLEFVNVLILITQCYLYVRFFFNGKIYEKILAAFIPVSLILIINQLFIAAFCIIADCPLSEIIEIDGELRIPVVFCTKFAFFLISEMIISIHRRSENTLNRFQGAIYVLCFVNTFVIAISLWNISKEFEEMRGKFFILHMLIALLNILLFILLKKINSDSTAKENKRVSEVNLAMQEKFTEEAREHYEEMRTLRHDMKHCLVTAASLISDGQAEEAKEYLEKVANEKVNSAAVGIDTGNTIIDAVINQKIAACAKCGIEMKCLIDSHFEGINDIDMSILLSNAMDNAAEGCLGSRKPQIELIVGTRMAFTYIIVRNSISNSVLAGNPKLVTAKKDKAVHGLGIGSMKKTVEKYGGSVEFKEENGKFITEIWLGNDR